MTIQEIFSKVDTSKLNSVHMDTYMDNPFMLLNRSNTNNVNIQIENNRIIVKVSKPENVVFNVLLDMVEDADLQQFENGSFEIRFGLVNSSVKCKLFCEK